MQAASAWNATGSGPSKPADAQAPSTSHAIQAVTGNLSRARRLQASASGRPHGTAGSNSTTGSAVTSLSTEPVRNASAQRIPAGSHRSDNAQKARFPIFSRVLSSMPHSTRIPDRAQAGRGPRAVLTG